MSQSMNSNVSDPGTGNKRAPFPVSRVQRRLDDRRLALEAIVHSTSDKAPGTTEMGYQGVNGEWIRNYLRRECQQMDK